ncbi:MAG: SAM-dependent methyltransferase [Lachnospiraceae bacterium]|nr:SAM-dependent methyltransferase [Lachnospiraceae bacterium]
MERQKSKAMKLSKRLQRVAQTVTPGYRVVDIGTDHGYVPIYLMEHRLATHVIAMDINRGPLKRAEEHIKEQNFEYDIETRLSDGFSSLQSGEADIAVIAGMGGELIKSILQKGSHVLGDFRELILSPHSEIEEVRKYLHSAGFRIDGEEMLIDDGKFYTIIKAVRGTEPSYSEAEYRYGKCLIEKQDEVLYQFLINRKEKTEKILEGLQKEQTENSKARASELAKDLELMDAVMKGYQIFDR